MRREEYEKNYDDRTVAEYKELTKGQSFAESHGELGKLLYSYSDGRAWIDLPSGQKFRKTFCHQRVFLFALAVLLCVWFVTALIYQLSVTSDAGKTLLRLLPSFILIAAGVMLVITHYLWITEIPPFLGVFFIGMSFLALCNVLSFIPAVNAVGIPLVFSLVLLIVPPWALVWFHRNIFHSGENVLSIILNCDVLTAGFSFFTVIGAYVFTFAVTRLVDYVIFGAIK